MGAVLSAQVPLGDVEEQRRRAQEDAEQRQRLQEAPHVQLQAPGVLTAEDERLDLPVETPSFRIDRFVLGVPSFLPPTHRARGQGRSFRFAADYLEMYRGRRIGPEGIKVLMRRLTRQILTRGYTTTRVDLPEQDLSQGTLELTLVPGIIRSIRFAGPAPRGTWRSAFPARPGDLLNLRDLEQGLEQMKRLPSQDVAIAIVPGALPGESEVVLTVRRGRPWRLTLSLDDSGLPDTGQWQAGLHAGWDNPLGRSDQLSASLSHDVTRYRKGSGTRGAGLSYALPMGYWTFGASLGQNDQTQRLAGLYQTFVSSGVSRNLDVRAGWLFRRGQTSKDTLQVRIGHRAGRAFLDDTEIEVQRRNNTFVEGSLTHTQYFGRAHLDVTAGWRQGVSWFGAQDDPQPGGPTFRYRLQTLDVTLAAPLGRRLQYLGVLHGQRARDPLYALDYLTLGSRWTVRGFDGVVTLGSDNGAFLRNDLLCPLGRATWYLGLDAGRVYGANEATLPGRALAGAVIGLKGVLGRRLSFEGFLGGPIHQPAGFPNRWPVAGFSASCHF